MIAKYIANGCCAFLSLQIPLSRNLSTRKEDFCYGISRDTSLWVFVNTVVSGDNLMRVETELLSFRIFPVDGRIVKFLLFKFCSSLFIVGR